MAGAKNQPGRERAAATRTTFDSGSTPLASKLAGPRPATHAAPTRPQGQGAALGQALRLGVELVAGVAVGGFIGWGLDRWFEHGALLMVVFLGWGRGRDHERGADRQAHAGRRRRAKDLPSVDDDDDE